MASRGAAAIYEASLDRGSSAIGATCASASIRRIAGATGKTAVGRPAAAQTVSYRVEVGIHDHPRPPVVAERRDPADREAGQLVCLTGGRAADVAPADHGGEPLQVDPIGARDEADDRLELGHRRCDDEDQRLDDLADLGATTRAASAAVWVVSGNAVTSRVTPFLAATSSTRWTAGCSRAVGTAARIASGAPAIGA